MPYVTVGSFTSPWNQPKRRKLISLIEGDPHPPSLRLYRCSIHPDNEIKIDIDPHTKRAKCSKDWLDALQLTDTERRSHQSATSVLLIRDVSWGRAASKFFDLCIVLLSLVCVFVNLAVSVELYVGVARTSSSISSKDVDHDDSLGGTGGNDALLAHKELRFSWAIAAFGVMTNVVLAILFSALSSALVFNGKFFALLAVLSMPFAAATPGISYSFLRIDRSVLYKLLPDTVRSTAARWFSRQLLVLTQNLLGALPQALLVVAYLVGSGKDPTPLQLASIGLTGAVLLARFLPVALKRWPVYSSEKGFFMERNFLYVCAILLAVAFDLLQAVYIAGVLFATPLPGSYVLTLLGLPLSASGIVWLMAAFGILLLLQILSFITIFQIPLVSTIIPTFSTRVGVFLFVALIVAPLAVPTVFGLKLTLAVVAWAARGAPSPVPTDKQVMDYRDVGPPSRPAAAAAAVGGGIGGASPSIMGALATSAARFGPPLHPPAAAAARQGGKSSSTRNSAGRVKPAVSGDDIASSHGGTGSVVGSPAGSGSGIRGGLQPKTRGASAPSAAAASDSGAMTPAAAGAGDDDEKKRQQQMSKSKSGGSKQGTEGTDDSYTDPDSDNTGGSATGAGAGGAGAGGVGVGGGGSSGGARSVGGDSDQHSRGNSDTGTAALLRLRNTDVQYQQALTAMLSQERDNEALARAAATAIRGFLSGQYGDALPESPEVRRIVMRVAKKYKRARHKSSIADQSEMRTEIASQQRRGSVDSAGDERARLLGSGGPKQQGQFDYGSAANGKNALDAPAVVGAGGASNHSAVDGDEGGYDAAAAGNGPASPTRTIEEQVANIIDQDFEDLNDQSGLPTSKGFGRVRDIVVAIFFTLQVLVLILWLVHYFEYVVPLGGAFPVLEYLFKISTMGCGSVIFLMVFLVFLTKNIAALSTRAERHFQMLFQMELDKRRSRPKEADLRSLEERVFPLQNITRNKTWLQLTQTFTNLQLKTRRRANDTLQCCMTAPFSTEVSRRILNLNVRNFQVVFEVEDFAEDAVCVGLVDSRLIALQRLEPLWRIAGSVSIIFHGSKEKATRPEVFLNGEPVRVEDFSVPGVATENLRLNAVALECVGGKITFKLGLIDFKKHKFSHSTLGLVGSELSTVHASALPGLYEVKVPALQDCLFCGAFRVGVSLPKATQSITLDRVEPAGPTSLASLAFGRGAGGGGGGGGGGVLNASQLLSSSGAGSPREMGDVLPDNEDDASAASELPEHLASLPEMDDAVAFSRSARRFPNFSFNNSTANAAGGQGQLPGGQRTKTLVQADRAVAATAAASRAASRAAFTMSSRNTELATSAAVTRTNFGQNASMASGSQVGSGPTGAAATGGKGGSRRASSRGGGTRGGGRAALTAAQQQQMIDFFDDQSATIEARLQQSSVAKEESQLNREKSRIERELGGLGYFLFLLGMLGLVIMLAMLFGYRTNSAPVTILYSVKDAKHSDEHWAQGAARITQAVSVGNSVTYSHLTSYRWGQCDNRTSLTAMTGNSSSSSSSSGGGGGGGGRATNESDFVRDFDEFLELIYDETVAKMKAQNNPMSRNETLALIDEATGEWVADLNHTSQIVCSQAVKHAFYAALFLASRKIPPCLISQIFAFFCYRDPRRRISRCPADATLYYSPPLCPDKELGGYSWEDVPDNVSSFKSFSLQDMKLVASFQSTRPFFYQSLDSQLAVVNDSAPSVRLDSSRCWQVLSSSTSLLLTPYLLLLFLPLLESAWIACTQLIFVPIGYGLLASFLRGIRGLRRGIGSCTCCARNAASVGSDDDDDDPHNLRQFHDGAGGGGGGGGGKAGKGCRACCCRSCKIFTRWEDAQDQTPCWGVAPERIYAPDLFDRISAILGPEAHGVEFWHEPLLDCLGLTSRPRGALRYEIAGWERIAVPTYNLSGAEWRVSTVLLRRYIDKAPAVDANASDSRFDPNADTTVVVPAPRRGQGASSVRRKKKHQYELVKLVNPSIIVQLINAPPLLCFLRVVWAAVSMVFVIISTIEDRKKRELLDDSKPLLHSMNFMALLLVNSTVFNSLIMVLSPLEARWTGFSFFFLSPLISGVKECTPNEGTPRPPLEDSHPEQQQLPDHLVDPAASPPPTAEPPQQQQQPRQGQQTQQEERHHHQHQQQQQEEEEKNLYAPCSICRGLRQQAALTPAILDLTDPFLSKKSEVLHFELRWWQKWVTLWPSRAIFIIVLVIIMPLVLVGSFLFPVTVLSVAALSSSLLRIFMRRFVRRQMQVLVLLFLFRTLVVVLLTAAWQSDTNYTALVVNNFAVNKASNEITSTITLAGATGNSTSVLKVPTIDATKNPWLSVLAQEFQYRSLSCFVESVREDLNSISHAIGISNFFTFLLS